VVRHAPTAASSAPVMEIPMDKREAAKKFTGGQLDAFAVGFGMSRNADESDDAFRSRLLAKFDADDAEAQRLAQEESTRQAAAQPAPAPAAAPAPAVNEEAVRAAERQRILDIRSVAARHSIAQAHVDKA